ncbi:NAD(P)-binding protein, partial [Armillaria solidipes]
PAVTVDLTGKTVVVVRANIGLWFEASKHIAGMDPERLILACRNEEKGKEAITGLANFGSVMAFTDKCARELDRLEILIGNAGMSPFGRYGVVEDWETFLHTNNFGPGLLAIHLFLKMIEAARMIHLRIVVAASDVHYWTTFEDELVELPNIHAKLLSKEYCTPEIMKRRYFDSKLLNMLFAWAFQQRLPPPTIAVNSVNPGFCISNLPSSLHEVYQEADAKQEDELMEMGSRQRVFSAVGGRTTRTSFEERAYRSRRSLRNAIL